MRRAAISACLLIAMTTSLVRAEIEEVERYDSLRGITLEADAVVLGRVRSVEPGRIFSGCGYAAATVDVEALLAGDLPAGSQDHLTLEYFGFCSSLPELGEEIPRGRAVFFLRNKGEETRHVQPDATEQEIESESMFWRTVIHAGTATSVHDVSDGGLLIALAEMARFAGADPRKLRLVVNASGAPVGRTARSCRWQSAP